MYNEKQGVYVYSGGHRNIMHLTVRNEVSAVLTIEQYRLRVILQATFCRFKRKINSNYSYIYLNSETSVLNTE